MKLVLASTSKFKSAIMDKVKMSHINVASNFEEVSFNTNAYDYVKELALGKANSVKDKVTDSIILGIDTVVYVNGKIIEKPKSINEVKNNLLLASNNTLSVISGIALINQIEEVTLSTYQETKVSFNKIDECDIDYYIDNEPDTMYVSGFIVETIASNFIKKIDGSFYNILGVPVEKIYECLLSFNIHLKDLEK